MADSSKRSVVMYGNRHGALLRANSTSIWDELSDADSDTESPDAQPEWRLKERMKTTSVALVLCLNIGTDPPDVVKPSPCARRECWIDPFTSQSRDKTLEAIGSALENQYRVLQSRAVYRQLLDPTVEDLRKLCQNLRRRSRGDRVLFHYNGHGVPRPTSNGEIWLFNKSYTQYIPLALNELRSQMVGSPAIYVLDCSGAGVLMNSFLQPVTPSEPHVPQSSQRAHSLNHRAHNLSSNQRPPRDYPYGAATGQGGPAHPPGVPSFSNLHPQHQQDLLNGGVRNSGGAMHSNGVPEAPPGIPPPHQHLHSAFQPPQTNAGGGGGGLTPTSSVSSNMSSATDGSMRDGMISSSDNKGPSFAGGGGGGSFSNRDCVVLLPCSANELLPMEPEYPADLFTTCLTTPIPMALRWFVLDNKLSMKGVDPDVVTKLPGKLNDRKTPLGELNWVFTAITDSIAWNSLSRALFQQLFRQDLLVASLFRNFLMADRVLRSLGCTPQSLPRLPSGTSQHQLWQSWDLAAECSLSAFLGLKIPPTINTPLQPYAAIPGMHHQGMPNATTGAGNTAMPSQGDIDSGPLANGTVINQQQQQQLYQKQLYQQRMPTQQLLQQHGRQQPRIITGPGTAAGVAAGAAVANAVGVPGDGFTNAGLHQQQTAARTSTFSDAQYGHPRRQQRQQQQQQQLLLHHGASTMGAPAVGSARSAGLATTASYVSNVSPPPAATTTTFFAEQLTAFEVWLEFGGGADYAVSSAPSGGSGSFSQMPPFFQGHRTDPGAATPAMAISGNGGGILRLSMHQQPPEQLPVVLQVLLSQAHRLRALRLLKRFFQLGPWAVNLALSVGIFPYVLKLLQSPAPDLRQVLVCVWAKILAFDKSCQVDLVGSNAHVNFMSHLNWEGVDPEQHVNAAFILTGICDGHALGKKVCLERMLHLTLSRLLNATFVPASIAFTELASRMARANDNDEIAASADSGSSGGGGGGGVSVVLNQSAEIRSREYGGEGSLRASSMAQSRPKGFKLRENISAGGSHRMHPVVPMTPIAQSPRNSLGHKGFGGRSVAEPMSPMSPRWPDSGPAGWGGDRTTTTISRSSSGGGADRSVSEDATLSDAGSEYIVSQHASLRRWLCICFGELCRDYPAAQVAATSTAEGVIGGRHLVGGGSSGSDSGSDGGIGAGNEDPFDLKVSAPRSPRDVLSPSSPGYTPHASLLQALEDSSVEVRAAGVYALSNLFSSTQSIMVGKGDPMNGPMHTPQSPKQQAQQRPVMYPVMQQQQQQHASVVNQRPQQMTQMKQQPPLLKQQQQSQAPVQLKPMQGVPLMNLQQQQQQHFQAPAAVQSIPQKAQLSLEAVARLETDMSIVIALARLVLPSDVIEAFEGASYDGDAASDARSEERGSSVGGGPAISTSHVFPPGLGSRTAEASSDQAAVSFPDGSPLVRREVALALANLCRVSLRHRDGLSAALSGVRRKCGVDGEELEGAHCSEGEDYDHAFNDDEDEAEEEEEEEEKEEERNEDKAEDATRKDEVVGETSSGSAANSAIPDENCKKSDEAVPSTSNGADAEKRSHAESGGVAAVTDDESSRGDGKRADSSETPPWRSLEAPRSREEGKGGARQRRLRLFKMRLDCGYRIGAAALDALCMDCYSPVSALAASVRATVVVDAGGEPLISHSSGETTKRAGAGAGAGAAATADAHVQRTRKTHGIYAWSHRRFTERDQLAPGLEHDPLSEQGARNLYWRRRNAAVNDGAKAFATKSREEISDYRTTAERLDAAQQRAASGKGGRGDRFDRALGLGGDNDNGGSSSASSALGLGGGGGGGAIIPSSVSGSGSSGNLVSQRSGRDRSASAPTAPRRYNNSRTPPPIRASNEQEELGGSSSSSNNLTSADNNANNNSDGGGGGSNSGGGGGGWAAFFGFGRSDGNGADKNGNGGKKMTPKLKAPRSVAFNHRTVLELKGNAMTSMLLFHPYESLLAVADDKDCVSLFDYESGHCLWRIRNCDEDAWKSRRHCRRGRSRFEKKSSIGSGAGGSSSGGGASKKLSAASSYSSSLSLAGSVGSVHGGGAMDSFAHPRSAAAASSRMTSLTWLNETGPIRLCIGSNDGVVRVWGGIQADGSRGGFLQSGADRQRRDRSNSVESQSEEDLATRTWSFDSMESSGHGFSANGIGAGAGGSSGNGGGGMVGGNGGGSIRRGANEVDRLGRAKQAGIGGSSDGAGGEGLPYLLSSFDAVPDIQGGANGSNNATGVVQTTTAAPSPQRTFSSRVAASPSRGDGSDGATTDGAAGDMDAIVGYDEGFGTGLISSFSAPTNRLYVGGNSSFIRAWDMAAERCVSLWSSGCGDSDYLTNCVTTITSCSDVKYSGAAAGSLNDPFGMLLGDTPSALLSRAAFNVFVVVAGYGDGELRLFDTRMPSFGTRNVVASWHDHESWILNAHMSSDHGIMSASIDGNINFFDLRAQAAVRTLDTLAMERNPELMAMQMKQESGNQIESGEFAAGTSFAASSCNMTAIAVHPCSPICVTGSYDARFIKVMTLDGIIMKTIKHHDGFVGQRIAPVTDLAFHPHRSVFAAGANDSIVSVYSSSK